MAHNFLPSSQPHITQAFLVANHKIDLDVRTRIAEVERHFSEFVKGEAKSTNVEARTPPPIPRLMIKDGGKTLSVSQNRIQLEFNFEPDFELDRALDVVMKKALPFLRAVSTFQAIDQTCMIGFVINVIWPSTQNRSELSELLAEHFYSNKRLGQVDAFEVKVGFLSDSMLFKNVHVSAYETREFLVPTNPPSSSVTFEIDSVPVIESGVSVGLDVNNRVRLRSMDNTDFSFLATAEAIIAEMNDLIRKDIYALLPVLEVKK